MRDVHVDIVVVVVFVVLVNKYYLNDGMKEVVADGGRGGESRNR